MESLGKRNAGSPETLMFASLFLYKILQLSIYSTLFCVTSTYSYGFRKSPDGQRRELESERHLGTRCEALWAFRLAGGRLSYNVSTILNTLLQHITSCGEFHS